MLNYTFLIFSWCAKPIVGGGRLDWRLLVQGLGVPAIASAPKLPLPRSGAKYIFAQGCCLGAIDLLIGMAGGRRACSSAVARKQPIRQKWGKCPIDPPAPESAKSVFRPRNDLGDAGRIETSAITKICQDRSDC